MFDKCRVSVLHFQVTQRTANKTMSARPAKSAHLATRVRPDVRTKFIGKALKYGPYTEVLRELIEAFVEDRLVIQPPVTSKQGLFTHD